MRQFTPWAHGVGGFLAHHHIGGFLGNLSALRRMDDEDTKWAVFLSEWLDRFDTEPVRCSDVMANAAIARDPVTARMLDPWDGAFITDKQGVRPRSPQRLGQLLSGQDERWHGDPPLRIRTVTDTHNGSPRYRVEQARP
jgi:hypothetical protein